MDIKKINLLLTLLLLSTQLFTQNILVPPDSLSASQNCDTISLKWKVPQQSEHEIIGYYVYLSDSLLDLTNDTIFQTQMQGYGSVLFNVSTLYDAGESQPASIVVELVSFAPATNLTYDKNHCKFYWSPPQGNLPPWHNWKPETLQWCDDPSGYSVGTGGAAEFEVAALWAPDQLFQFNEGELYLTKIDFNPAESFASYSVKVWESSGPDSPDEILYIQAVTNFTAGQWNSITLSDSVLIDINKYLWVGYEISTPVGFPAGVDDGPAIDGYGNMMNFGGWQTSLEINPGLDCNWNIRAGFQYNDAWDLHYDIYGYWECNTFGQHWVRMNDDPIYDTSFFYGCFYPLDDWWGDSCYVQINYCGEPVNSDTVFCEICWASNSDPMENYYENSFSVSSGNEYWIIHSEEDLIKILVFDLTGKIIYTKQVKSKDLIIDHQGFAPGMYIIEGISEKVRFIKKIYK